jgi:hypothetical protein
MASTISNINTALVDERVIAAMRYALPMTSLFSFGITADEKLKDEIVRVPIATDPSVATKTAGTMLTAGGTLAGTNVTLSSFRGAAWDATEGTISSAGLEKYWADKAAGAVYATVKDAVDAALALVTAANYGNTEGTDKLTKPTADFDQAELAKLWGYGLTKIKNQKRVLLLNTNYSASMLGQTAMAQVYAFAGENYLKSGKIPEFGGMQVMTYADLPANAENLGGVVLGQGALLLGTARPSILMESGDGNIADRRVITDPETGLSVLYTMKADAGGTITGEVAMLYGVAKGQDAVVRLVTA